MPVRSHGRSQKKDSTYACWKAIKQRCAGNTPDNTSQYLLRGIKVCARWLKSFENFLADMGDCPKGFQIDRINNNKGYFPDNCRWVDKKTQMRNTRLSLIVKFKGEKIPLLDLCEKYGINQRTVKTRLRNGWRLEEAITTPVNPIGVRFPR